MLPNPFKFARDVITAVDDLAYDAGDLTGLFELDADGRKAIPNASFTAVLVEMADAIGISPKAVFERGQKGDARRTVINPYNAPSFVKR